MPNRNYINGRQFEYKTMQTYRDFGYSVIRASGSHGQFDIIAFNPNKGVDMVQCKRCQTIAQANRLIKQFEATTIPTKHYHQTIVIQVKGQAERFARTV